MCDFSGKLIAWLDRELPAEEAAEVERHLEVCSECQSHVNAYQRVSNEFDAYCNDALASNARRGVPRWGPVASAAVGVAAVVALFLVWPRTRVEPPAFHHPQPADTASPIAAENVISAPVQPIQRVHRRQAVVKPVAIQNENSALTHNQNTNSLSNEPMIQIAIPADEMFPPGAVPEGMHFVADVTIAADGSAEWLRLRPRLTSFERRTTQP